MTESEDAEQENAESDDLESNVQEKSNDLFRERITTVMIILSGVAAAFASNNTVGFQDLAGILTVIPFALFVVLYTKYKFDKFGAKTVAFTFIITTAVWFVSGTFILQLS